MIRGIQFTVDNLNGTPITEQTVVVSEENIRRIWFGDASNSWVETWNPKSQSYDLYNAMGDMDAMEDAVKWEFVRVDACTWQEDYTVDLVDYIFSVRIMRDILDQTTHTGLKIGVHDNGFKAELWRVGMLYDDFVDLVAAAKAGERFYDIEVIRQELDELLAAPPGSGDMTKAVYDTADNGKVDLSENSELLQGNNSAYHLDRANHSGTQTTSTISGLDAALASKIESSEKGAALGVAPLDSGTKIAAIYLPSYVDDVEEYDDFETLPVTGESGKIYITLDDNSEYRWSGSVYVELIGSPGTTDEITEGAGNLFFTPARVLAVVLTGLSFASNVAITAADSVIVAFGKLQRQITDLIASVSTKQDTLVSGTNIKTVGGNSLLGAGDIPFSDPSAYTTIVASANQDVTNAGVTNHTEFTFAVVAGAKYMIRMELALSANNATGDFIMDFNLSAGTMKGKGTCQNLTSAAAVQNIIVTAAGAANTTGIVTGAPTADIDDLVAVSVAYAFTCTSNGTLTFRFGNSAPSGSRTSRVNVGSVMKYKRLV